MAADFVFRAFFLFSSVAAWIFLGTLTYEIWAKPTESWQRVRERLARRKAWARKAGLGILPVDILGLENNKRRYLAIFRTFFLICDFFLAFFSIGVVHLLWR